MTSNNTEQGESGTEQTTTDQYCEDCGFETPHRQVGDTSAPGTTYQCLGCIERKEIEAVLGVGQDV